MSLVLCVCITCFLLGEVFVSGDLASCSSVFSRALGFCRYADAEATKTFHTAQVLNSYTHMFVKTNVSQNALHTVIQMTESRFRRFGFDQKRYHQLDQGARRCAGPPCELLCSRCTEWWVCLLAFLLPLQEQRSFWPTVVSIPVPWQCTLST